MKLNTIVRIAAGAFLVAAALGAGLLARSNPRYRLDKLICNTRGITI
jgi:hypothetical protein